MVVIQPPFLLSFAFLVVSNFSSFESSAGIGGYFTDHTGKTVGRLTNSGLEDRRFVASGNYSQVNGFHQERKSYTKAKNSLARKSNTYLLKFATVVCGLVVIQPEDWLTELEKAQVKDKSLKGYIEFLSNIDSINERERKLMAFRTKLVGLVGKEVNCEIIAVVKQADVIAIQYGLKPQLALS